MLVLEKFDILMRISLKFFFRLYQLFKNLWKKKLLRYWKNRSISLKTLGSFTYFRKFQAIWNKIVGEDRFWNVPIWGWKIQNGGVTMATMKKNKEKNINFYVSQDAECNGIGQNYVKLIIKKTTSGCRPPPLINLFE